MDILLREPTQTEFLEVAQFSFENFITESALSSGESVAALKEKFGGQPVKRTDDVWLMVECGGERLGFAWFQIIPKENSAFGWDIHLDPAHRGKGVGRFVMQACIEDLRKRGVHSVKLCVFEHNQIARKLYESLGFTVEKFNEKNKQFTLALNLLH